MRYLLLIPILFVACRKEVKESEKLECYVFELTQKPSLTLSASVSGGEVRLSWNKKGRQTYTVYRDGVQIHSCQCGTFTDIPPSGVHTYRVNNSNTVTVNTTTSQTVNRIRVDFDGGLVPLTSSWWNLQGQTVPGSGLNQDQQDSVLTHIKKAYSFFDVQIITDGEADQVIYLTTYWEWFGSAGGVAFIGSWGSNEPAFVFTERLAYRWFDISFASVHELGHTLGLYHAVEDCSQSYGLGSNWMKGGYQWNLNERQWEILLQIRLACETVNQPQTIQTTLL